MSVDDRTTVFDSTRAAPGDAGPMGLLVVDSLQRSLIGAFFELSKAQVVVGRGSDAEVHVQDQGISRHHLRIERWPGGEFVAVDLSSTNGTFLNGVKIRSAVLAEGDLLQIGTGTELRFGPRTPAPEPTRTRTPAGTTGTGGTGSFEYQASTKRLTFSGALARRLWQDADTVPQPDDETWYRIHEEDREALRGGLQAAVGAGGPCEMEFRLLGPNAEAVWVGMKGEASREGPGHPGRVAGIVVEISDRNRAELELRRQSLFFSSHSDAIAVLARGGEILDWNPSAERLFGWTKAEALGKLAGTLLPPASGEDELGRQAARCIDSGERFETTESLRWPRGGACEVQIIGVPLRDPDGVPRACVVLFRDEGQRRRALAQMQMTERLASIGTLAAGVAHEVNNPLAFITANLEFVREQLLEVASALGPRHAILDDSLADCHEGLERIRVIVQDLKVFSVGCTRPEDESVASNVDVNKVLQFAFRVAEGEARKRARIVTDLSPVPAVIASEARLGQVFLNLVLNAAQAIPEGDTDANEIRLTSRLDSDGQVVVEVTDTGCGIRPENLRRIFDPFFTTKPAGVGTGLGLFVCQGILASLGGEITVSSTVGRGTTFRVRLPAATSEAPRAE
jgi:PAS domain S-box-containing protein